MRVRKPLATEKSIGLRVLPLYCGTNPLVERKMDSDQAPLKAILCPRIEIRYPNIFPFFLDTKVWGVACNKLHKRLKSVSNYSF